MSGIQCLMINGPGITAGIRNNILLVTAKMRQEIKTKVSIRTKFFEGIIKTKLETRVLGSLSGLLFEAEIECERGKTFIRFIVNERELLHTKYDDIESAVWINLFTGNLEIPEKQLGIDPALSN
jgi:hypothetical protein